jgi:hypothetical protein
MDCKLKLDEYVNNQLAVKLHQHELIEAKDNTIFFYQPFQGTRRRVIIEEN